MLAILSTEHLRDISSSYYVLNENLFTMPSIYSLKSVNLS